MPFTPFSWALPDESAGQRTAYNAFDEESNVFSPIGHPSPYRWQLGTSRAERGAFGTVVRLFEKFFQGVFTGLTTINVGDEAENTAESIAGSLGHLLGFIGFIPGVGTPFSLGLKGMTGILRGIGVVAKAGAAATEAAAVTSATTRMIAQLGRATGQGLLVSSVPMTVATYTMKGFGKIVQHLGPVSNWATKHHLLADLIQGGAHLGIASAVSAAQPWELHVQDRLEALGEGAIAGMFFRGLGNLISTRGPLNFGALFAENAPEGAPVWEKALRVTRQEKLNLAARTVSAAIFMGLPSTLQDHPLELQIYSYLLGGYFGKHEIHHATREAWEYLRPFTRTHKGLNQILDLPKLPGFADLRPDVQQEAEFQATLRFGKLLHPSLSQAGAILAMAQGTAVEKLAKAGRISDEEMGRFRLAETLAKKMEELEKAGEPDPARVVREHLAAEAREDLFPEEAIRKTEPVRLDDTRLRASLIEARLPEQAASTEIAKHFAEHDTPSRWVNPIYDIAEELVKTRRFSTLLESTKAVATHFDTILHPKSIRPTDIPDRTTLDELLTSLKTEFAIDFAANPKLAESVIRGWLATSQQTTPAGIALLANNGQFYPEGAVDAVGNRLVTRDWPSWTGRLLGRIVRIFSRLEVQKKSKAGQVYNTTSDLWAREVDLPFMYIQRAAYRQGLSVLYGNKDKPRIILDQQRVTNPDQYLAEKLPLLGDEANQYQVGLQKWVTEGAKLGYAATEVERMYRQGLADFIHYLEDLNGGLSIQTIMAPENTGRFIRSAAELNKRGQLLDTRDPILPYNTFDGLPDLPGPTPGVAHKQPADIIGVRFSILESRTTARETIAGQVREPPAFPPGQYRLLRPSRREPDKFYVERLENGVWTKLDKLMPASLVHHILRTREMPRTDFAPIPPPRGTLLPYIIVNTINKNGLSRLEGQPDYTHWVQDESGAVTQKVMDAHLDGGIRIRRDVYDRQAQMGGRPPGTSFMKGTVVQRSATEGLLLTKPGMHAADPQETAHFHQLGIAGWMYSTAIKQRGLRTAYDMVIRQNGDVVYYKEGTTQEVTPIPISIAAENISVNQSVGETADALAPVNAPLQLGGNFNSFQTPGAANAFIEAYCVPSIAGNSKQNALVRQWAEEMAKVSRQRLGMGASPTLEKITEQLEDPEAIGLEDLFGTILLGKFQGWNSLYTKMVRKLLHLERNDPEFWSPEQYDDAAIEAQRQALTGWRSVADKILANAPITVDVMESGPIKNYWHSVLRNYLLRRTMRPKIADSFKAFMTTASPFTARQYNLQPGECLVDNQILQKTIRVRFRRHTIGQILERYNKLVTSNPNAASLPALREALELVGIRVPSDSVSGARIIRIKGGTGIDGSNVVLHPKDMWYLGGADTDGDTIFMFPNFTPVAKTAIRRLANEWETNIEGKEVLIPAKLPLPGSPPLERPYEDDYFQTPFAMLDPMARVEMNKIARQSNNLVGIFLSTARRYHTVMEAVERTGGVMAGVLGETELNKLARLMGRPSGSLHGRQFVLEYHSRRDGGQLLRSLKRYGVQRSVDAADGIRMVDFPEAVSALFDAAFKEVRLYEQLPNGTRAAVLVKTSDTDPRPKVIDEATIREHFRPTNLQPYASITATDRAVRGRFWKEGRNYSLEEVFSLLKGSQPVLAEYQVSGMTWATGQLLANFQLDFRPNRYLGREWPRLHRLFNDLFTSPTASWAIDYLRRVGRQTLGQGWSPTFAEPAALRELADKFGITPNAYLAAMRSQDQADLTSAEVLQEVPQLPPNRLTYLTRSVDAFLSAVSRERGALRWIMHKKRELPDRGPARLGAIIPEMEKWFYKLSPEERQVAEQLILSSIHIQGPRLETAIERNKLEQEVLAKRYLQLPVDATTRQRTLPPGFKEELERTFAESKELEKLWKSTNWNTLVYSFDFISPEAIKKWWMKWRTVTEDSWGTIEQSELNFVKRASEANSPYLDALLPGAARITAPLPEVPKNPDLPEQFLVDTYVLGKPKRADLLSNPRFTQLYQNLHDLFMSNPRIASVADQIFSQLMGRRGPETATVEEMEHFYRKIKHFKTMPEHKKRAVPKLVHFLWPEALGRRLEPFDTQIRKMVGEVHTPHGWVMRPLALPLSTQGELASISDLLANRFDASKKAMMLHTQAEHGWEHTLPAKKLRELYDFAIAIREAINDKRFQTQFYGLRLDMAKQLYGHLLGEKFTVSTPKGGTTILTGAEIIERINQTLTAGYQHDWNRTIVDPQRDAKHFEGCWLGGGPIGQNPVTGLPYQFPDTEKVIAKLINAAYQRGPQEEIGLETLTIDGYLRLQHQMYIENLVIHSVDSEGRLISRRLGDFRPAERARLQADITTRALAHDPNSPIAWRSLERLYHDPGSYHAHNNYNKKVFKEYLAQEMERELASQGPLADLAIREAELRNLLQAGRSPDGGMLTDAIELLVGNLPGELASKGMISEADIQRSGQSLLPTFLGARQGHPVPGYDTSLNAVITYRNQLNKSHHNLALAVVGRHYINRFRSEASTMPGVKPDYLGKYRDGWVAQMELYLRDQLGYPSFFPTAYLQNKSYQIRNNPYWLFTDHAAVLTLMKLARVFGKKELRGEIDTTSAPQPPKTTEEEAPLDWERYRENMRAWIAKQNVRNWGAKLNWLSTWEGKWEMWTLLSTLKTSVVNRLSGHTNTIISAGFRHWFRAGSLEGMLEILPSYKTMDGTIRQITKLSDYDELAELGGSLASFLLAETGMHGAGSTRVSEFARALLAKEKGDPKYRSMGYTEIGRDLGFTEEISQLAAYFMRSSERALRRRSWLAHYLKAREVFSANEFTFDHPLHPWLVTFANRGVAGTQYLYDNAHRPAFARTNLGKIFSRFQLWTWNSLRFRQEVYKEAKLAGFVPESEEFVKLRRLMTADMFMLALATMFPASIFDNALAPPYNILSNLADVFFGDDKRREQAFFGTLPWPINALGVIQPPVLRYIASPLGLLVSGNLDRFAEYHAWTFFPFGRLALATARTLKAPEMGMEAFAGIPVHKWGQIMRKKHRLDMPRLSTWLTPKPRPTFQEYPTEEPEEEPKQWNMPFRP